MGNSGVRVLRVGPLRPSFGNRPWVDRPTFCDLDLRSASGVGAQSGLCPGYAEVPDSVSAGSGVLTSGYGETARDRDRLLRAGGVASAALPSSTRFDRDLVLRADAWISGSVVTGIASAGISTGTIGVADF